MSITRLIMQRLPPVAAAAAAEPCPPAECECSPDLYVAWANESAAAPAPDRFYPSIPETPTAFPGTTYPDGNDTIVRTVDVVSNPYGAEGFTWPARIVGNICDQAVTWTWKFTPADSGAGSFTTPALMQVGPGLVVGIWAGLTPEITNTGTYPDPITAGTYELIATVCGVELNPIYLTIAQDAGCCCC